MYWLNTLVFMYVCGITGSMLGAAIFSFPKTTKDMDFIFWRVLFWPHYTFVLYRKSLEIRAEELAEQRIAYLRFQLDTTKRMLRVMAQSSMAQDARYDELLQKYIHLHNQVDKQTLKLPEGVSIFDIEEKPRN